MGGSRVLLVSMPTTIPFLATATMVSMVLVSMVLVSMASVLLTPRLVMVLDSKVLLVSMPTTTLCLAMASMVSMALVSMVPVSMVLVSMASVMLMPRSLAVLVSMVPVSIMAMPTLLLLLPLDSPTLPMLDSATTLSVLRSLARQLILYQQGHSSSRINLHYYSSQ